MILTAWFGTWHWWAQYGLQGIAGGVLGGAVTGAAVWLTLRHEMRRSAEQLTHNELMEVRRCVAELQTAALRVGMNGSDGLDSVWNDVVPEMGGKLIFVRARTWSGHEELSEDLLEYSGRLGEVTGGMQADEGWPVDRIRAFARHLVGTLTVWQMDPGAYPKEREPLPTLEAMLEPDDE